MESTKKVVLNVPVSIHRQVKADAAKNGITLHDYCIKVLSESISNK
jgi:predicted HicB family RNase H-like nuclease